MSPPLAMRRREHGIRLGARLCTLHIYEILGCTQEMRSESIHSQSDMGIRVPRGYSDIHNGPDSRRAYTLDTLFTVLISPNDYSSRMLYRYLAVSYL